jgi:hypothetical protein
MTCPGYKSLFDVAWRNQNLVAEKSVRRRKNAIEKAYRERTGSQQLVKLFSPNVPGVLAEDYEGYAISFFFSSYILISKDLEVQRGFLNCLYPVWVQTESASPLRPAVAAVASCLLQVWSQLKSDVALSLSQSLYSRGVASLRKTLRDAGEVGDDVLMAALMLDMYESLRSFFMSRSHDSPHLSGTTALVEYPRRLPFASKASQRVLLGARNQIIGRALKTSEAVPPNVFKWDGMARDVPKTLAFRLDDLNMEVANLQALISRLDSGTAVPNLSILDMLKKATELDRRLLAWATSVPDSWTIIRVSGSGCIPQSVRDSGLYEDHCGIYQSIFIADIFNTHCCSRIKMQLTILACLKHLHKGNCDSASVTALKTIQELADNICASVPYHLGNRMTAGWIDDKTVQYPHVAGLPVPEDHPVGAAAFGGWFLAGQLSELLSLRVPLRVGQRQWIGGQMQRVMRIYAIQPQKSS